MHRNIHNERYFICDALRYLVPFAQVKNVKNTDGGVLLKVKVKH